MYVLECATVGKLAVECDLKINIARIIFIELDLDSFFCPHFVGRQVLFLCYDFIICNNNNT